MARFFSKLHLGLQARGMKKEKEWSGWDLKSSYKFFFNSPAHLDRR
jgi:hypothetical protein